MLGLGPLLAVVVYSLLPGAEGDESGAVVGGLTHGGRAVAACAVLMASWWMTEALPIEVTGLVPLALFPVLGVASMEEAAAPYATDIIFLFLGGMLLGQAMERWGLHTRFALMTISAVGSRPTRLVGGFLIAAAFLSMWVSNTAATVMMLPIGASVAALVRERFTGDGEGHGDRRSAEFGAAVVLAIAFGATIGGVGTLIGTPPTAQFAGFMARTGTRVTFLEWLRIGLPVLLVMLPVTWVVLTRIAFRMDGRALPGVRERIKGDLLGLGPMSRGERATMVVFVSTAAAWVGVPLVASIPGIKGGWLGEALRNTKDSGIAIIAAIALFVIPVNIRERRFVLSWREAERIPWGILLLFGGGLSLAAAIKANGVDLYIAGLADGLGGLPLLPMMLVFSLVCVLLTEFTSNTALVAAALPVGAAIAQRLEVPPAAVLITITLAASLGFMMPAGTAPNALVFASGRVSMRQMMRAGIWLDLLAAVLVPLVVYGAMRAGVLPGVTVGI